MGLSALGIVPKRTLFIRAFFIRALNLSWGPGGWMQPVGLERGLAVIEL